ncbi:MAG: hypothetical protein AAF671_09985 [Pseudomonadota bacterium]
MNSLRSDVKAIFFWSYAAIALSLWALIGFLPIAGMLIADAPIKDRVIHGVFLVSGFVGIIGVYIAYLYLRVPTPGKVSQRSLAKPLTVYATLWLAAYWTFAWPG